MKRPSYADVVSTLCLFIVLGTGTAYAATVITGKQVKDGSLTGKDIASGSVAGNDIKNGSIGGLDVAYNAITGDKLKDGSVGSGDIADGSVGSSDLGTGSVGSSEIADASISLGELTPATRAALSVRVVSQQVDMVPADLNSYGAPKDVDITCPDGTRAIGGGAYSEHWIEWGTANGSTAAGNIGAKPTGRPVLGAGDEATGWHLQVTTFPHDYGVWMLDEVGPQPTPPFTADQWHPMTAYALCAA